MRKKSKHKTNSHQTTREEKEEMNREKLQKPPESN